ncbi:Septum site-determining protein MinC [Clostridiales bacterium CHKCI001]|nr:Septum site-determining protein MinC [Clostridiales bacterium CHKCI001]
MKQLVMLKGNRYGITVYLDPEAPFDVLKEVLKDKLGKSADFFRNVRLALTFEGRVLNTEQQRELLDIIESYSQLNIVCIMQNEKDTEDLFRRAVDWAGYQEEKEKKTTLSTHLSVNKWNSLDDCYLGNKGQFYKGTLHFGQIVESESSIVVLGSIQNGAKLIARGNIVILGSLKGAAYAGAGGKKEAFIAALDMETTHLKIGNVILPAARLPSNIGGPQIARIEKGSIHIRPLVMY